MYKYNWKVVSIGMFDGNEGRVPYSVNGHLLYRINEPGMMVI